ncbi:unnamed protein product [Trichogramma brassicae]|uniref:Uncharacterized protein n=1 Tax=Trichogramma brassicae TaxID=86971 RepID=A0A6H5IQF3_9HYME|nr:unnamed protein product [Trichogramma brassicae]
MILNKNLLTNLCNETTIAYDKIEECGSPSESKHYEVVARLADSEMQAAESLQASELGRENSEYDELYNPRKITDLNFLAMMKKHCCVVSQKSLRRSSRSRAIPLPRRHGLYERQSLLSIREVQMYACRCSEKQHGRWPEQHNYFEFLPENRALNEDEEKEVKKLLSLNCAKNQIRDLIREMTGKHVQPKDIQNVAQKIRDPMKNDLTTVVDLLQKKYCKSRLKVSLDSRIDCEVKFSEALRGASSRAYIYLNSENGVTCPGILPMTAARNYASRRNVYFEQRHRLIPGTASNERFNKSCRIFPGSVWNRPAPVCIK